MTQDSRYLTLLAKRSAGDPDCYVCLQIAQRKAVTQGTHCRTCLLCNNPYCETHKGSDDGTCNINHRTYYSKPKHRARHASVEIFPSIEARRQRLSDIGLQRGKRKRNIGDETTKVDGAGQELDGDKSQYEKLNGLGSFEESKRKIAASSQSEFCPESEGVRL